MFAKMNGKWLMVGAGATIAAAAIPGAAKAEPRGFAASFRHGQVHVSLGASRAYETVARTIIEPAIYENVERRVWREPIYEDRIVTVEIPARFETRRVPRHDRWGRFIGHETVTVEVEPARTECRTERVLVKEGCWETIVERVMVKPETTRIVYDRVPDRFHDRAHAVRPLISKARPHNDRRITAARADGRWAAPAAGFRFGR